MALLMPQLIMLSEQELLSNIPGWVRDYCKSTPGAVSSWAPGPFVARHIPGQAVSSRVLSAIAHEFSELNRALGEQEASGQDSKEDEEATHAEEALHAEEGTDAEEATQAEEGTNAEKATPAEEGSSARDGAGAAPLGGLWMSEQELLSFIPIWVRDYCEINPGAVSSWAAGPFVARHIPGQAVSTRVLSAIAHEFSELNRALDQQEVSGQDSKEEGTHDEEAFPEQADDGPFPLLPTAQHEFVWRKANWLQSENLDVTQTNFARFSTLQKDGFAIQKMNVHNPPPNIVTANRLQAIMEEVHPGRLYYPNVNEPTRWKLKRVVKFAHLPDEDLLREIRRLHGEGHQKECALGTAELLRTESDLCRDRKLGDVHHQLLALAKEGRLRYTTTAPKGKLECV